MSLDFSITVVIGKLGSGKSTLARLALYCYRYKLPEESHHNLKNYYKLGKIFIKSNLNLNPYASDAYLKYSYAISPDSRGFEQMSLFTTTPAASCYTRETIIRKIIPTRVVINIALIESAFILEWAFSFRITK